MKKISFLLAAVLTACTPEKVPETPEVAPAVLEVTPVVQEPEVVEVLVPSDQPSSALPSVPDRAPETALPPPKVQKENLPLASFSRFTVREYSTVQGKIDPSNRTVTLVIPYGASLRSLTPVWTSDAQGVTWQGQNVGNGRFTLDLTTPQTLVLFNSQGRESSWTISGQNAPPNLDTRISAIDLGGAVLDPAFSPEVQSYSLLVPAAQRDLPVSALPSFGKSKIFVQMNDSLTPQVLEGRQPLKLALKEGENNLFLKVVAEDGKTTTYYVVVIKRK